MHQKVDATAARRKRSVAKDNLQEIREGDEDDPFEAPEKVVRSKAET